MKRILSAIVFFAALTACASQKSTVLPISGSHPFSGNGTLEVKMEDENTTRVSIRIAELTDPEMFGAGAYVAWAVPANAMLAPENLGTLVPSSDHVAKLDAKVEHTHFWLMVTAERSAEALTPDGVAMLSAEISRTPGRYSISKN